MEEKHIEGELVPIENYVPGHKPAQGPTPELLSNTELRQIFPEFFNREGVGEILDEREEA